MLIQSRSNGDTEAGALMFVFYFDKVAYQLAMLELMRFVCVFVNMIMFVKIFNVKCSIYTINKKRVGVYSSARSLQLFLHTSRINFIKHLLSY